MLYEVPLGTDFSEYMGTYLERFVDHDPLSDESIARYRRHKAFINASGLIEEPRVPSPKHGAVLKQIVNAKDHVSFYWLGGQDKIPFVLTEPCGNDYGEFPSLKHIVLPEPISPYGGGPFSTETGLVMPTCSLLCVKEIHTKHLKKVEGFIMRDAQELSRWNSVSDEERREARSRHLWGRK